jgi:hypothetical protein
MRRLMILFVTTTVAGLATQAHADKKDDALSALGVAAGKATTPTGLHGSTDAQDVLKAAMKCVEHVGPVKAAGGTGGDQVPLDPAKSFTDMEQITDKTNRKGERTYTATVYGVRQWCVKQAQAAATVIVESSLGSLAGWESLDPAEKDSAIRAEMMIFDVKGCHELVELARATGIADDVEIDLGSDRKVKLGEAEDKICKPAGVRVQEVFDAVKKKKDDELAPWRSKLSGDKLRIFDDRNLGAVWVRGKGGDRLDTPEKLASAKLWFEVWASNQTADGYTDWRLVRYQFDGMKLTKGPTEKTGRVKGTYPPTGVFK